MLSIILHAKTAWMPSICYILNYYIPKSVYLYLLPLLLHSIGNLLAYAAALCGTTIVCGLLSVHGRAGRA